MKNLIWFSLHQNFNIRKNDCRQNHFSYLHCNASAIIYKSNVMGRLLENLYQEAIESSLGIHLEGSVIFLGHKISRIDDNTIRICETNSRYRNNYKPIGQSQLDVLLENGWVNGVKQVYLNRYIPMSKNPDYRMATFAKSKLIKYYERFPEAK